MIFILKNRKKLIRIYLTDGSVSVRFFFGLHLFRIPLTPKGGPVNRFLQNSCLNRIDLFDLLKILNKNYFVGSPLGVRGQNKV